MKIWIIWSQTSDIVSIMQLIPNQGHEYVICLDNRYGPWWWLMREDSIRRVELMLDVLPMCDCIIVPPVYEYAFLRGNMTSLPVLDIWTQYIGECVLKYSVVGKIGLIGYKNHQDILKTWWGEITNNYSLTPNQSQTKRFDASFPIFPLATDHRSVLWDLPRSWFTNKLIKTDLKKMKDYSVDSLLPLEWWYLKFWKTIKQTFYNKVRWYGPKAVRDVITVKTQHMESGLQNYEGARTAAHSTRVLYTGPDHFKNNKIFMWTLYKDGSSWADFRFVSV